MKTKINGNFEEVLKVDIVAETEKHLGKNHTEFNEAEGLSLLMNAFSHNEKKGNYLKSLGDTYFSITWDEFIHIIESYGFEKGLSYEFKHDNDKYTDEAVLYYHTEKGLLIWATSYFNKTSLNGGTLYGEIKSKEEVQFKTVKNEFWDTSYEEIIVTDSLKKAFNSMNNTSHNAYMGINEGVSFSYDVREGLINKIEHISDHFEFNKEWVNSPFLWFLDFTEESKDDDYKGITNEKINKAKDAVKKIVNKEGK